MSSTTVHICDVCEKTFDTFAQLGGHRGAHTRRGEAPPKLVQRMNGKCPECDEQFESAQTLAGHRRRYHSEWSTFKTDGRRKFRLLLERGHQCELCSLTEWMGKPIPIQLDHLDGNPNNSDKDNLRLICPNCHAQTDTYCGKNIGRPKCIRRVKSSYPSYRSKKYVKDQIN